MQLKQYQTTALDAFTRWLDALTEAQTESTAAVAALQGIGTAIHDDIRNYPKTAWQTLSRSGGVASPNVPYVTRTDEAGRPIPHVCFKVPTGGGKTLLAAAALERLNQHTGLVLWIVPKSHIRSDQGRPAQPGAPLPPNGGKGQWRTRQVHGKGPPAIQAGY